MDTLISPLTAATSLLPNTTPITVARGDGIGPEIMDATFLALEAAGASLAPEWVEIGEAVYRAGHSSGIDATAWESIRRTGVLLKAPITTPQGGGYKSLNVTLRKSLGLYANVRPCPTYHPFVGTTHPGMDVVVVRENEEDLYAGIEHRQTDEVVQCLKLVTRPGCERIARYAFEYARAHGRRKVTCMTKDNIMKLTDGLFRRVFEETAEAYPEIEREHMIVDIGAARLATRPEAFDVVLAPNLYGDILSDIAAEVAGSVGLAGSSNVGASGAMFEAVHGSAPDLAGQDRANPTGLLLAAVAMLVHVGQPQAAERLHNAVLRTLEDGLHTGDVYHPDVSARRVGTRAFGLAVAERMGERPRRLREASYGERPAMDLRPAPERALATKETVGVDVFVEHRGSVAELANRLRLAEGEGLGISMVTNRGVMVWPTGLPETLCSDHWRCRFTSRGEDGEYRPVPEWCLVSLLGRLLGLGLAPIKTETLCRFDGKPGFSLGQGE